MRTGFGNPERPALDDLPVVAPDDDERLLAMNEALERFAKSDPRKAELVRLRYFVGLDFEAAAEVLAVAVPTAKQWMAYARAWLKVEMTRLLTEPSGSTSPDPESRLPYLLREPSSGRGFLRHRAARVGDDLRDRNGAFASTSGCARVSGRGEGAGR